MKRLVIILFWMMALGAQAQEVSEELKIGRRQMIFLREGPDVLFGNLILAVENRSHGEKLAKIEVMLPKETLDFAATEGVEQSEVKLEGDKIVVEKLFPPGMHVIGFGFKNLVRFGSANLSFRVPQTIDSLTVLASKQTKMQLSSSKLIATKPDESPDENYQPYINREVLNPGDSLVIEVTGLPEGRTGLWILGGAVSVVLILLAFFFAWRTRPRVEESDSVAVLIG